MFLIFFVKNFRTIRFVFQVQDTFLFIVRMPFIADVIAQAESTTPSAIRMGFEAFERVWAKTKEKGIVK